MDEKVLQFPSILNLLHIRVSTYVFLLDEDVGNSPLARLSSQIGLNFLSIIDLIQLVDLERSAKLGESLLCLTTIRTPAYVINTVQ